MMQSMLQHYENKAESSMSNIDGSRSSDEMEFPVTDNEVPTALCVFSLSNAHWISQGLRIKAGALNQASVKMTHSKQRTLHKIGEARKHSVIEEASPSWDSLAKSL
eukprot:766676-Hanusia_phi.AAC.2